MDRPLVTGWAYLGGRFSRLVARAIPPLAGLLICARAILSPAYEAASPRPEEGSRLALAHDPITTTLWQFECPRGPAIIRLVTSDTVTVQSPGKLHYLRLRDGSVIAGMDCGGVSVGTVVGSRSVLPGEEPAPCLTAAWDGPGRRTLRPLGPYVALRTIPDIPAMDPDRIGDVGVYDAVTGVKLVSFGGETSLAVSPDGVILAGSSDGVVTAVRPVRTHGPQLGDDPVP